MHSSMIGMAMGIFLVFISANMALPLGDTTPMSETFSDSSEKHEPRDYLFGQPSSNVIVGQSYNLNPMLSSNTILSLERRGECKWTGHCAGASCTTYDDCDGDLTCVKGKCGGGTGDNDAGDEDTSRREFGSDLESSTPRASETGDKKEPRDIIVGYQPTVFGPASYPLGSYFVRRGLEYGNSPILGGSVVYDSIYSPVSSPLGSYFVRRGLGQMNDLESSTPRYRGLTETASDNKVPRDFLLNDGSMIGGSVVYDPVNVWPSNSYFVQRGLGNTHDRESSTPMMPLPSRTYKPAQ